MDLKALWQRPESRFLIVFLSILGISFTVVALKPVNDAFVVPYTTLIAKAAGIILGWFGEDITMNGCVLRSPRFAVTIYNGCNGLITSLIFISGVLAFPAPWTAKLIGVAGGLLAIQVINMIRIISLFYIGIYLPELFNSSHIFIWQSLVILAGVTLWIIWAHLFTGPPKKRA
ncbi:MAG: exosortase H [Thermoanaerobaculales bacterium]|jgi:exosortase H (IPTLxxWG-CTERM-specific)|nr:exosortase H [Thermoanaerobaculales bacterium]